MQPGEEASQTIFKELTSADSEVRARYLALFDTEAREFADIMGNAMVAWRSLDGEVRGNERKAYVAGLVFAAITLHVISLKLFLSGHIVAAGNLFRQVIESIALALLCSGKDLEYLDRFMKDEYSGNLAVRDVLRQSGRLGVKEDALEVLRESQEFYHRYSHMTRLTLATLMSFAEDGLYVGASFDEGKVEAYRKEMAGRLGLARVFPNFVAGVKANFAKW